MPYLICEKCEIYYEIGSDFDINDFKTCNCGENLKYYENFDEYYNESELSIDKENIDETNYTKNKKSHYNKIVVAGFILAVMGLFVLILAYVSPFLFVSQNIGNFQNPDGILNVFVQIILIYIISFVFMVAGVLIYIYGKREGNIRKSNKKGGQINSIYKNTGKEKLAADYLKNLPEGYFILNNLKIPGKRIKIDHVVIGPTGIFLTHIKELKGHYIINENEWLNGRGKMSGKTLGNPSQQVKLNAIELKRFLESKNLNIDYILINSIVAFTNNNFKVRKMPKTYDIMRIEEISNFIVNSKRKMDMGTVTESVILLDHYSSDVLRT